ncbi:MAG: hypothetical protein WC069_00365 [Candidatus Shapirobacteria bacterium]
MSKTQVKNTLQNEQSTKPLIVKIPPKFQPTNNFLNKNMMSKNGPSFLQRFRTQSRGGK